MHEDLQREEGSEYCTQLIIQLIDKYSMKVDFIRGIQLLIFS